MATYFIDAIPPPVGLGNNANSGATALVPKQHMAADANGAGADFNTSGNIINLKRGQIHPITTWIEVFGSRTNVTIQPYGTGANPIIKRTVSLAYPGAIFQPEDCSLITFLNVTLDSNGFLGNGIINQAFPGQTVDRILLDGLETFGAPNLGGAGTGFQITGSSVNPSTNCVTRNCYSHDNANSGFHVAYNVANALFYKCVSRRDCNSINNEGFVAFSDDDTKKPTNIIWLLCEADTVLNTSGSGDGSGFNFDINCQNSMMMSCYAHLCASIGFGGFGSGTHVPNNNFATGCLSVKNGKQALQAFLSTNEKHCNFTMYKNMQTGSGSDVVATSGSTGFSLINSILVSRGSPITTGVIVTGDSVAGSVVASNCINGYTTPVSGIADTGTITVDPQFNNPDVGDFSLKLTSPCIGAGTWPGFYPRDVSGEPMTAPWDIGAYWSKASRRTLPSGRSVGPAHAAFVGTRTAFPGTRDAIYLNGRATY